MMCQQKHIWIRLFYTAITIFITLSICIRSVCVDIYDFKDNSGVHHVPNVPAFPEYRLYLESAPSKYLESDLSENISVTQDFDQYDSLILKASIRHDVDFSLLKSIIKVESNFDCYAVSQKGATGLMQIIPRNFTFLNIRNPFDPEENIMGGTLYFKQLLEKFNKTELALAAYNAGPNAVNKFYGIPANSETKKYVKKVMTHYKKTSGN